MSCPITCSIFPHSCQISLYQDLFLFLFLSLSLSVLFHPVLSKSVSFHPYLVLSYPDPACSTSLCSIPTRSIASCPYPVLTYPVSLIRLLYAPFRPNLRLSSFIPSCLIPIPLIRLSPALFHFSPVLPRSTSILLTLALSRLALFRSGPFNFLLSYPDPLLSVLFSSGSSPGS